MPSGCFTGIPGQRPILDRVVWHGDPIAMNEHLHAGWRHSVRHRETILVVTATVSPSVFQRRVDVVGFGGGLKTDQADRCKKLKLERHRPLSLNGGLAALVRASGNATVVILLLSGDPVVASAQCRITSGMEHLKRSDVDFNYGAFPLSDPALPSEKLPPEDAP